VPLGMELGVGPGNSTLDKGPSRRTARGTAAAPLSQYTVSPAKTAAPIEMPFGLRIRVDPGNHVLDGGVQIPSMGKENFEGKKGRPVVKYRDTLRTSSVQKGLNRSRCRLGYGSDGQWKSCVRWGPEALRDVAMATNFGTQFAITGFMGYNFSCIIASDTLFACV